MEYLDPFFIQEKVKLLGLSTDSKPTTVKDGSVFVELNTPAIYVFYKGTWYKQKQNSGGGGGTGDAPDIQIDGVSIVSDNVANILTKTAYNASTNKIVTESDIAGKQNNIAIVESQETTLSIDPNKFYVFPEVASLTITLNSPSDSTIYNEYMFQFDSGTTPTSLTLPNTVSWVETPTIEASKTYQVSIVNNIALIVGV